ncbi:MAG: NYN domain-containing protein [Xenococcaceae cyanobacterium MO_207.B15]|nr:NYN domain-containing protein [Xenococcaceae cyanobacterium MO_207.B15]
MSAAPYQAFLLVDGYNIIGSWSDLKKSRDRYGLDAAREILIESLINYAPMVSYRTKIVFDAHYQNSPSHTQDYTSLVSVYFTEFAETADTYIEKSCAAFKRNPYQPEYSRLIVATSDRAQRLTVTGYGAECISAQRLAGEVEITARKLNRKKRPAKKSSGRFLFHSLDPVAQQRLQQLRHGKI